MATGRFLSSWIRLRVRRARDRGNVEVAQERGLRRLVAFARQRSPFYRARLPEPHPGLTVEELPVTTRAEMDRHFDQVLTVPDLDRAACEEILRDPHRCGQLARGKYFIVRTSGTGGRRMPVVYTAAEIDRTLASAISRPRMLGMACLHGRSPRVLLHQLLRRVRVAVIIMTDPPLSQYAVTRCVSDLALLVSRCRFFSVTAPLASVLDGILEFGPDLIISYPSFLHQLALAKEEGSFPLTLGHPCSAILSVAECLPAEVRTLLESTFRVPVMDYYSLAECLSVAVPCAGGRGLHINEDTCILECVDRQLRPVPPGVRSEKVLLTNLINFTQPFIRYEVDDSVTVAPGRCPCGSPFRLVTRIQGKVMTTFWIGEGVRARALDARLILTAMEETPGVRDFQAVQTGPTEVELRVVCAGGERRVIEAASAAAARYLASVGLDGAVRIVPVSVKRLEPDARSGKLKRFVPLAPAGARSGGPGASGGVASPAR